MIQFIKKSMKLKDKVANLEDKVANLEEEVKRLKSDIRAKEIWEQFQKEHDYFKRRFY